MLKGDKRGGNGGGGTTPSFVNIEMKLKKCFYLMCSILSKVLCALHSFVLHVYIYVFNFFLCRTILLCLPVIFVK